MQEESQGEADADGMPGRRQPQKVLCSLQLPRGRGQGASGTQKVAREGQVSVTIAKARGCSDPFSGSTAEVRNRRADHEVRNQTAICQVRDSGQGGKGSIPC